MSIVVKGEQPNWRTLFRAQRIEDIFKHNPLAIFYIKRRRCTTILVKRKKKVRKKTTKNWRLKTKQKKRDIIIFFLSLAGRSKDFIIRYMLLNCK